MNRTPDAVVVGAGIVGVSTAFALVNAGLKVVLLDRENVAGGTTSAGEGNILVSDKGPGPELELARRSRNAWFELALDVGDGDPSGGFELEAKGGVVVARNEEALGSLLEFAQTQIGASIDAREVSTSALRELEPQLSRELAGGVWYPEDSQCQPMLAAALILKKFGARGGEFLPGAAVKRIVCHGERADGSALVSGLETSVGDFSTPLIINAGGTWAGEIAKMAGSHLPIEPRRGFILVTVPAPKRVFHKVYDAHYVANVASGQADLQTSAVVESTQSGTILIGASRERVGFSKQIDFNVLSILARQAIELFPFLEDVQLLRAYSGFRPFAPDHLPVIGEDSKIKGLWHNAGHEGAGIGLAPASGQLLSEMITGRPTFMDAAPFSPHRFALSEKVSHD